MDFSWKPPHRIVLLIVIIESARKRNYHDKNARRRTSIMKVDVGVEMFFDPFIMFVMHIEIKLILGRPPSAYYSSSQ